MHHVVELWFDEQTDSLLRAAWQALNEQGLSNDTVQAGGRPHISLTSTGLPLIHTFESGIDRLVESLPSFELEFGTIKYFPGPEGICYLEVLPNDSLLRLHAELCDLVRDCEMTNSPYFEPGSVVFHSTSASGVSEKDRAHLRISALPSRGILQTIALVEYAPAVPIREWKLK